MLEASDIVSGLWIIACVILSILVLPLAPMCVLVAALHISEIQERHYGIRKQQL